MYFGFACTYTRWISVANSYSVSAVSKAILGILVNACNADPVFTGVEFKIVQPTDFQKGVPLTDGVSIYLYRVVVNGQLRNRPPRPTRDGKQYGQSLPIDLYYLLSFWGSDFDKQHRLLGWAMRTLEDHAHLPVSLLNSFGPETETFHDDEVVDLTCDVLTMQDMLNINDILKPNITLSVGYIVRTVFLDTQRELPTTQYIQTREYDIAKPVTS